MRISNLVDELNSINNPENKDGYLSSLISKRFDEIADKYEKESEVRLLELKEELKTKDSEEIVRMYNKLSKEDSKILMILDEIEKLIRS